MQPSPHAHIMFSQVLNTAQDSSISITSENSLPCHDREGYNKILETAKPMNDPDGRHLISFAYHRLSSVLLDRHNLMEFERFIKRMHGKYHCSACSAFYFIFVLALDLF